MGQQSSSSASSSGGAGGSSSKKFLRTKSKELATTSSTGTTGSRFSYAAGDERPPLAGTLALPVPPPGGGGAGGSGGRAASNPVPVGGGVGGPGGAPVRGRQLSSGAAAAGAAASGRGKSPPPISDEDLSNNLNQNGDSPSPSNVGYEKQPRTIQRVGGSEIPTTPVSGSFSISSTTPPIPTTQTIMATPPSVSHGANFLRGTRSGSPPPPSATTLGTSATSAASNTSPMMAASGQSQVGSLNSLNRIPSNLSAGTSVTSGGGYLGTSPGGPAGLNGSNSNLPASSGSGSNSNYRTLDVDNMISRLLEAGYSGKVSKSPPLKNAEITSVCLAAREVFLSQPTLIELSPPVKIVGDVHGQYADLIRLFEMCGFPPSANYLFLGDYVDRGKQSLETILLLLCYKIKYPENFFLLRGNHECANVTRVYGFYDECKRRTNIKTWKTFIDVFNTLPIASIVAGKIFCVHGGLSPSLTSMDDIRRIQRPTDVPDYGLLNDLVWSDPSDTALEWEDNERGVSYCYGKAVINSFLATHDMDLICRAHMVVEDGYEFYNDRTLVTVFSAPNYCGEFDNFAAVMSVSEDLLCSFELLKPLDAPALKKEMTKAKRKSLQAQSPPASASYGNSH